MHLLRIFLVLALTLGIAGAAGAALITPASIAGSGDYTNDKGLIIDNAFVAEITEWTDSGCVYSDEPETLPSFVVNLGGLYRVEDIVVQVDNNDTYKIAYSTNGTGYTPLLTILEGYGYIGSGMDTMSTVSGDDEYVDEIDFSTVTARYLKIYVEADGSDDRYSISELQTYGSPVPLPGAVWLLGSGLGLLAWRRRRS